MRFFYSKIASLSIVFLCLLTFSFAKPPLQLAKVYLPEQKSELLKLSDYWVSEKFDGVRGFWDGKKLLTRQGYRINAPKWFTQNLGADPLDGELWIKRNAFDKVSAIIRSDTSLDSDWQTINFMIFDLPNHKGTFDQRIVAMNTKIKAINQSWVKKVPQVKIHNQKQLDNYLNKVVMLGGEGLMLHKGSAYYRAGRTDNLLKFKQYEDREGIVIAHLEGKGKYKGMMGSLLLELDEGIQFKLGTGFTDEMRKTPPKIGVNVTFQYNGLTKKGIPRFARFLRVREEL